MKNGQNARILHDICPKNTFSRILRAIQGSKKFTAEMSGLDPNTHCFTGAIVLNKPFVRLHTLLYSISLDAQACHSVTEDVKLSI